MPKLTNISQLNTSYIEQLINQLLSTKLYRSEVQLQFDIAWQIKEDLILLSEWDVCLEYLSATILRGQTTKRLYTDIIVYNEETKEFIPIEIKYKTNALKGSNVLKNHGAQDLGAYNFLWDVKRIEMLKTPSSTTPQGDRCNREIELSHFIRGFAVLVTNDNSYLRHHPNSCAKNFYFVPGKTFYAGNAVDWDRTNPSTFYIGTWRNAALTFSNNYICNWNNTTAPTPHPEKMQYLIFEII